MKIGNFVLYFYLFINEKRLKSRNFGGSVKKGKAISVTGREGP
jgi:hypothetical protein